MPPEPLPWDRKDFAFKERKQYDRSDPIAPPGPAPVPPPHAAGGAARWNDSFQHHNGFPPREFHNRWAPPPDFRRPPGDRKDGFFKDRKHERSELLGPQPRWRDSSSYHHGPRDGFHRWGPAEFRRPPGGYGRQGGWHMFPEESGHGYGTARSDGRILEDDGFRSSRGDGRYSSRNNRDNRAFGQRDWRGGHSWETSNSGPPPALSAPVRQHDVNGDRKSVDNAPVCPAPSRSEFVDTSDSEHIQSNDQHDKMGGVNGFSAGQGPDKGSADNSLGSIDWKPFKWTRSGSMNSRGSGLTNLSSSKGMTGVGPNEAKAESQPKDASPLQSPEGNVAASVTSSLPEEATCKKKPRLGWGEGLAKYEKKKVEGPDDIANKDGLVPSFNLEPVHSVLSNLADRSPRILGLSECASPATPSSVACSSSPGLEEKMYVKASNTDVDVTKSYGSLSPDAESDVEEYSNILVKLESSISCLGFSVIDEPTSSDPCSGKFTTMDKLLLLKGEVLKELEMTESRIDLLENELKFPQSISPVEDAKPGTDQHSPPRTISHPTGPTCLHIFPSVDIIGDNTPLTNDALEEIYADAKDGDADSPGSTTSKVAETSSRIFTSDIVKNDKSSANLSAVSSGCVETKGLLPESHGDGMVEKQGSRKPDSDDINDLCNSILFVNRESAEKAFKELDKLLPSAVCESSVPMLNHLSGLENDSSIEEKFVRKKRFHRFKERVLSIKYKIFRHMWKRDLGLLSIRKQRARSQKRSELSLRYVQSGSQKRRASICSRLPSPGTFVPKTEMINFTRKLLQDSHDKLCRNTLKMPELILDEKDRNVSRFISANGLVEDPCSVERERALINPWTSEEKEIFMDKLTEFGKDFRRIATFLEHKTTADCVEFYYKNHKADCFAKTKRQDLKKQAMYSTNTYLMMAGKKWNNAANLKVLGTVSEVAASAVHKKLCSGIINARCSESTSAKCDSSVFERSGSYDILRHERETMAADVLAGMCASLSSQPMSSCISGSVDPNEGYLEWRYHKVNVTDKRGVNLHITEDASEHTCSDDSYGEIDSDHWKDEEKSVFIQAFASYGKDFKKISLCVRTKSMQQCKVFFSKTRKILRLDSMCSGPAAVAASPSDDENGGGSDTEEDVCAAQQGSTAGCDTSGSKVEKINNINHVASGTSEKIDMKVELILSGEAKSIDTEELGDKDVKVVNAYQICQIEDRPESVMDGQTNGTSDLVNSEVPPVHEKAVATVDAGDGEVQSNEQQMFDAEPVSLNKMVDPSASSSDSVDNTTELGETVRDGTGSELELSEVLVCDDHLNDRNGRPSMFSDGNVISQSRLQGTVQDSNCNTVRISLIDCSKHEQQEQGSRVLAEQVKVGSAQKDIGTFICKDLRVLQEGESAIQDSLSSTRDHQDNREKQCQDVGGDDSRQKELGHSLSNQMESSKNLPGGLPPSNEVSMGMCVENILVHSSFKSQKSFTGQYNAKGSHLKKCRSSKSHSSGSEFPLSKSLDHISNGTRPPSRSSSDSGKPSTKGDVRLFGQILNQAPSQVNSSANVQLSDESSMHKLNEYQSSNLRLTGHQSAAGSSTPRFDFSNSLALENFRMNQGYWDERRMQCFSLPDSQTLLAKYHAAFGNYSTAAAKMQPQSLQSVIHRSDYGTSMFSTLESSGSNGVVDFQRYGSRVSSQVYPFRTDIQQPFSQMQRYSSFEAMSALQQQGRGIGMNVVGGGEILVGGLRTAVQDPVAAIRMHYATSDKFGGPSGSIRRAEEAWRIEGDMGR